jgi:hypothetical protein
MMSMPEKMRVALRVNGGPVLIAEVNGGDPLKIHTDCTHEWAFVPDGWTYTAGKIEEDAQGWNWQTVEK